MLLQSKKYDRRQHIKPVIFGVEGLYATAKELELFNEHNPLGFILFSRNIDTPEQVHKLVNQLKSTVFPRHDVLVLIDQEGGRVSRLKEPYWKEIPPASEYGELIEIEGLNRVKKIVYNNFRLMAFYLRELGINANCAPLLDIYYEGADDIIGDRSFSSDAYEVAQLGKQVSRGLLMGNVFPIMKHIPGHGRANADSHLKLPVIDTKLDELIKTCFEPFKRLANTPFAMTAHILYTDIDDKNPATTSKAVIDIIRKEIGFTNLLMTDDLSMKALSGTMAERAKASLEAGCDIVLHCNGDYNEMLELASSIGYWSAKDRERFRSCWKYLHY